MNRNITIMTVVVWIVSAPWVTVLGARKVWNRRPGVILYQLNDRATAFERSALTRTIGIYQADATPASSPSRSHQTLQFNGSQRDEEDLAEALRKTGAVLYAEPDYLMPAALVPNDPGFSAQWHHTAIHSQAAWDLTTGTTSVIVAVCDTGIDATHPDLAANLSLPGFNSADGTTNTSPVADHGTAVAGLIGASGNNGMGGAGVAWKVQILPVRITNNTDTSAWCSDMATGVEWAADHGAKVINLSYDITGCPNTINAASLYAQSRGAVTFIAAGNGGINIADLFPQPHAFLLVGATGLSGQRAFFSNFGPPIDLVAPGESIYSTMPGNSYAYGTGTSFAAPISAGVAALLFSINPAWTPDQIRVFMLATAHPANTLNGYGQLDAYASLSAAKIVVAGGPMPVLPANPGLGSAQNVMNDDSTLVYPNPWRADQHAGIPMIIDSLTAESTVKIFTLSGFLVRILTPTEGKASWDLKNTAGDPVASGLYFYSAADHEGHQSQGKLAVIR